MRQLRKAVMKLSTKSLPNKKDLNKLDRKKEEKIKKAWRKQTMMDEDAKRLAAVTLRQGRIKAILIKHQKQSRDRCDQ